MNKEEKEAIDILENCIADYVIGDFCCGKYCPDEDMCKEKDCPYETAIEIVVNLIKKQEKEIKNLKDDISNMYDEKVVRNILEDECGLSKYEIDEILN